MAIKSSSSDIHILTKRDVVAIQVLNPELPATIGMVTRLIIDRRTPALESLKQGVYIVDPELHVPHLLNHFVVRNDRFQIVGLAEHQIEIVTPENAKTRWIAHKRS